MTGDLAMRRIVVMIALAGTLAVAAPGCWGPPQVGADRESFEAVDALYTAVGLRDAQLVADSERRLQALRDSARLPEKAHRALTAIIATARAGEWEPAVLQLGKFMEGQSR